MVIVLAKKVSRFRNFYSLYILTFTFLDHVKISVGHNFNLFGEVSELMMCMVKQISFYTMPNCKNFSKIFCRLPWLVVPYVNMEFIFILLQQSIVNTWPCRALHKTLDRIVLRKGDGSITWNLTFDLFMFHDSFSRLLMQTRCRAYCRYHSMREIKRIKTV